MINCHVKFMVTFGGEKQLKNDSQIIIARAKMIKNKDQKVISS